MAEWGVSVLGIYQAAAEVVNAVNDCLAKLRADGVIR
jgi:hypothetical protein